MNKIIVCLMLVGLVACKKNAPVVGIKLGTYKGTFERLGATSGGVANVAIHFAANTYTGESNTNRYPAISGGNYIAAADSIQFFDASFWTADFDWTLILDGNYKMTLNGDSLVMRKYYNGIVYMEDVYRLKKQ